MKSTERQPTRGSDTSRLRITKKLATSSRGAIKLADQFGDALVCVRHRSDPESRYRYTTVELLIDATEIRQKMVQVRVHRDEYALKAIVRAAGAVCDRKSGLWQLPQRVATALRLNGRIVKTK